jgi:hypothetical protein
VGAKHFKPENSNLNSVENTVHVGHWPEWYWPQNYWPDGYWVNILIVELTGKAREQFGSNIEVLTIAKEVMKFWENYKDLKK